MKIEDMTREQLIQLAVDQRAGLESTLKALQPAEQREGGNDTLHLMQDAARILGLLYGPEVGFFIFAQPFDLQQARGNYTSNMERKQALDVMVEFLQRNQMGESWMKHIL